jgi:hypothetical protein
MGARKQTDSPNAPRRLSSLFSGAAGVSPAIILGVLFFVCVVAGVVYGWHQWGRTVVARPIYRIAAESIEVTAPPAWIRTDVRSEVVRDGALNDLTIFDKDATIRVYQAFELHPWIAKVQRVSKHPPARLVVDLEYRQPVAWVEVPGAKPGDEGGVIPIDGSAYVLPSRDFTKEDLKNYLRISIKDVRPYGLAGTLWGDPRVSGAARIASALQATWQQLRLFRIQSANEVGFAANPNEPIYELETATHGRIVWGNAPGMERPEEPSVAVKLNRLAQVAESFGSLDRIPETGVDLRNADSLISARTASRDR